MIFGVTTKIVSVMDACSRGILHQRAHLHETGANVAATVRGAFARARALGMKILSFLSDHGRSYKAGAMRETVEAEGCLRTFAPPYRPQGKAPVERYFGTMKAVFASRWQVFILFLTGLVLAVKGKLVTWFVNLALQAFTHRYNQTPNPGIDGKSPDQRLADNALPAQAGAADEARRQAALTVLRGQAEKSKLKSEIVDALYTEFGWTMPKRKVHAHLEQFRKEAIEQAAQALRRKLVTDELDTTARWLYLAKVAADVNRKLKERNLEYERLVLAQQAREAKARELRQAAQARELWEKAHPEAVLEENIEWRLAYWDNDLWFIHGDRLIKESLSAILLRHSRRAAHSRVEKLCQAVLRKDAFRHPDVLASGRKLPKGADLEIAKKEIVALLRKIHAGCQDQLPARQLWPRLWRGPFAPAEEAINT